MLGEFRGPLGIEYGQRNIVRGPGAFFLDAGLGKKFPIIEDKCRTSTFRAPMRSMSSTTRSLMATTGGSLDIVNNAAQTSARLQAPITELVDNGVSARVAQFSLRLDF